jgi:preprotein translocase subunit YajC
MGGLSMILIFLPMILLFLYMSRSQTKKQKELESSLKSGDRVITQSGLVGRIVELTDTRVKLEIAPGVTVQMLKSALSGLDHGEAKSGESKAKESGKEKSQEKKA